MDIHHPIVIRLVNQKTRIPAPYVVGTLTVYAAKKKNYEIDGVSDKNGLITFTRETLEAEINTIQSLFLSDYLSTLEECHQFVTFKVPCLSAAKKEEKLTFLSDYQEQLWKAQEKYHQIRRTRNDLIKEKSIAFHVNPEEETRVTIALSIL